MKSCLSFLASAVISVTFSAALHAREVRQPVTIDDLVEHVQILRISLAPDGRRVAYLTVKGLPRENVYEVAINLVTTSGDNKAQVLSRYRLPPEGAFEANSGSIQKTVGQIVWTPDSKELIYTAHLGPGMEVRILTVSTGLERVLLKGFEEIEIDPKTDQLELKTIRAVGMKRETRAQPKDFALLVKDGYRFYGPLPNPKTHGMSVIQHWKYIWRMPFLERASQPDEISYLGFPEEWVEIASGSGVGEKKVSDSETIIREQSPSPNGSLIAMIEDSTRDLGNHLHNRRTSQIILKDSNNEKAEAQVLVPPARPRAMLTILGWSPDGKEVYFVSVDPQCSSVNSVTTDGRVRQIYKEASGFSLPNPSMEISRDGGTVVFVRSTNVVPDELVKLDLKTGVSTVLSAPNEKFKAKALPKVRFVRIDCCADDFYGRLYLPANYEKGKKYPLVFTNYVSGPGFYASVGDEVPVPALAAHGIAVFAMNAGEVNSVSTTGDFSFEISRVRKPLDAMEWVYHKLADEGLIDRERCGLTGLSYGAEIAMYAYWNSKAFRALSVATTSWEPMNYVLAGVPFAKFLDSRGFALPNDGAYAKWKELSAGLNARPDLPPLLLQSPDGEEYFGNIETWFRLRQVGAQIEWYEYPDEGHVKRSPANRWWVYQRNLDWFRFWLKNEEDPNPTKAEQYGHWNEMRKHQEVVIPGRAQD